MYVIAVIPLKKGIQVESLTYFSKIDYPYGTFVKIPVRGKEVLGIVSQSEPASATKTALRSATFSLRKLPEQPDPITLPANVLATVRQIAAEYPAQPGAILYDILPPDVRDGSVDYPKCQDVIHDQDTTPAVLQAIRSDRIIHYRSYIREAFAHRGSVMLVVPTATDIQSLQTALESGIEDRIVTFGNHQTKKQRAKAWEQFIDLERVKLIITTPSFLLLERCDLTHLIIEQSGSPHYKRKTRPYLDCQTVAKRYAKVSGRALLLGDILPQSEDESRRRDDRYQTASEQPKRLLFPGKCEILSQKIDPLAKEPFALLHPELRQAISYTGEGRQNVFLLNARKGLASMVTCVDCGHIFRCPDSGVPYSLFENHEAGTQKRWLLARTSGRKIPMPDTCPNCGGWRLKEYGIGIQQVHEYIKKTFPHTPTILFDHTTATTHKRGVALQKQFYDTKGGIMIGTPMALPYLTEPISLTAVVSYDALRSTPSWRADESTFRTLLQLRDRTEKTCIIQTRSDVDQLLDLCVRGTVEQFYDDELALREALHYPPVVSLILLTWQGTKDQVWDIESRLAPLLTQVQPQYYTDPTSLSQKRTRHGLIRIKSTDWPNPELLQILRSLPPYVRVEVNPDRIV